MVNEWEGRVDDKPENSCCQLLIAFSRSVVLYDFYRTSKWVDTVFISLNLEMITTAFFGTDAAISNDFYPQIPNTSEKSFQGGFCHQRHFINFAYR